MPIAKLIFYSEGIRVLRGEVIPERLMDKEDLEMMKFMEEHKEDLWSEVQEIIRDADKDEISGLYSRGD